MGMRMEGNRIGIAPREFDGNGNNTHKIGNRNGKEWELTVWEWERYDTIR